MNMNFPLILLSFCLSMWNIFLDDSRDFSPEQQAIRNQEQFAKGFQDKAELKTKLKRDTALNHRW